MSYDYKILSKLRVLGYKVYKIWNGKSLYTYTKDNKVCGIVDAENRYVSEVRYTQVYAYQNIALCEQEHREDIKHIYYNCKMYDIFELLKLEPKNIKSIRPDKYEIYVDIYGEKLGYLGHFAYNPQYNSAIFFNNLIYFMDKCNDIRLHISDYDIMDDVVYAFLRFVKNSTVIANSLSVRIGRIGDKFNFLEDKDNIKKKLSNMKIPKEYTDKIFDIIDESHIINYKITHDFLGSGLDLGKEYKHVIKYLN